MARPRFENVDPKKKQRLLDAAAKEFAANGFEGASINRILEAAGLSKGAFYYYFDDKADLAGTVLVALAEPALLEFEVRDVATPAEFWAELRRVSHQRLKLLESDRQRYEAIIRIGNAVVSEPSLLAKVTPLFNPGRAKMAGFLELGVRLGALRSDLPIGTLMSLIESVKTTLHKATFPGDQVPTDAQLEAFTDQVLDLAVRIASPAPTP